MANQDILFPLMPRNTQVDVGDRNLRVKRIEKRPRSHSVHDEDMLDATQEARVRDYLQHKREHAELEAPDTSGENHASHTLPPQDPVAEDPRKQSNEHKDDDHKGVFLDTYV
ncbi:MAG: hypothetical protein JJU03_01345 [Idiomarina sp.]|nr:hypothetical protein [Idiomarina sp.]